MKQLISILTFLLAVSLTASANHDFYKDGFAYSITRNEAPYEVKVEDIDVKNDEVSIPATVTYSGVNYNVTSICAALFEENSVIRKVTLPNSLTSIPFDAFCHCYNLTSVNIPQSVTSIANRAFKECKNLTEIIIPSSVESIGEEAFLGCGSLQTVTFNEGLKSIGDGAFKGCNSLTTVTFNEGLTSIGDNAFYGCMKLTSISISSTVNSIGTEAFSYCPILSSITVASENTTYNSNNSCNAIIKTSSKKLVVGCKSTTIPTTVTSIGTSAFNGCTNLASITIPTKVTSIGTNAFFGCTGLTSITIPTKVTSIGASAFDGCTGLATITIPDKVTNIDNSVFRGCTNVLEVTIGSGVESIGDYAFEGCKKLVSVLIPENVKSIGKRAFAKCGFTRLLIESGVQTIDEFAFESCDSVKSVYCLGNTPSRCIGRFEKLGLSSESCKVYVPVGSAAAYTAAAGWQNCNIIPSSIFLFTVSNKNVSGARSLKASKFPGAEDNAAYFSNFTGNKYAAAFRGEVTEIEDSAFTVINSFLSSIILPNTIKKIAQKAFIGCSVLTSLTLSASLESVESNTFPYCENVTLKSIPKYYQKSFKSGANLYVTLNDEEHPYVCVGTSKSFADASYTRTFDDNFQILCLPFITAISINDGLNPFDVYEITGATENAITVKQITYGYTTPNTPYIVKAKKAGTYTIKAKKESVNSSTMKASVSPAENTTSLGAYSLVNSYHGINYGDSDVAGLDWYAMKGGKFLKAGTGAHLYPFRAYLIKTQPGALSSANSIAIKFEEDAATGVESVGADESEKVESNDTDGYTLWGTKAAKNQKGYVITGGKVIFR